MSAHLIASAVVLTCSLAFITFAAIVFVKPSLAERLLAPFASSARAHYIEQSCRLTFGTSLVVLSPTMWQTSVFKAIGWLIVMTSLGLILLPWQWHHRFGERVRPLLFRYLKLYAVGALALGILLIYAAIGRDFGQFANAALN